MFKNKLNLLNEKGFTLPELLVALVLASIVMIGFIIGIAQVVKLSYSNQNKEVSVREVDTAGTWFVRDFLSASVVPGSVDLTPNNGNNISITQSIPGQNDTTIAYSVDSSGNLLRQTTISGSTTSFVIGTGVTLVHYVVSSNSVNQISITSAGLNSVPITKKYNVETRIYNSGLFIVNSYLPDAFVGVSYNQDLQAIGGKEPFTWTLTPNVTNHFPAWASPWNPTGLISGTPTSITQPTDLIDFSVTVTDVTGATAERSFSIKVVYPLVVSNSSLPSGEVGLAYSQGLAATGGASPYFWSLDSGSGPLPDGLTLDPTTGNISGTPTKVGTFPIIVDVSDADANSASSLSNNLQINIVAGPNITTTSLPDDTVGVSYGSQTLTCTGGVPSYTWSHSGNWPTGLTLNTTTGVISGTPTSANTYAFTITVTDSRGATNSKNFTITIYAQLIISTNSLPNGNPGISYSQTVVCTGGVPSYTFSINSGTLPGGLGLNPATGVISGTPTTPGTYPFTVKVADSASHNATKSLSIVINQAISITTTSPLLGGRTDQTYSQTIVATGCQAPYAWTWSGSTPGGLTINSSTGTISGTPTTAGTYTFTVTVTDSFTSTTNKTFVVTIVSPPVVTTVSYTNLTSSSATLNGNLVSKGSASTVNVYFQWGLDTNYGSTTSQIPMSATGTFSANITGLTNKTTYHFRAVAVGAVTVYGSDLSFKTPNK